MPKLGRPWSLCLTVLVWGVQSLRSSRVDVGGKHLQRGRMGGGCGARGDLERREHSTHLKGKGNFGVFLSGTFYIAGGGKEKKHMWVKETQKERNMDLSSTSNPRSALVEIL